MRGCKNKQLLEARNCKNKCNLWRPTTLFFFAVSKQKLLSPPAEFLEIFTVFLILQGVGNGRLRHTKKYQKNP
jgi:hypothetical protein